MFQKSRRPTIYLILSLLVFPLFIFESFKGLFVNSLPPQLERVLIERLSQCRTASIFRCEHCIPNQISDSLTQNDAKTLPTKEWHFIPKRDERNYQLSNNQCNVAFPGLFEEIHAPVQRRRHNAITQEEISPLRQPRGTIRLRIYENELFLMDDSDEYSSPERSMATLQAIHRAVITSPSALPNIEFAITTGDFAPGLGQLVWAYTRTAEDYNTWLMPDFGFWSYGLDTTQAALGSWTNIRRRIRHIEEEYSSFSSKIPKALWRGDSALTETLRSDLISQTNGEPWADVRQKRTWAAFDEEAIPIHEHCKYMFPIHTEGVSYSARLKYLQNCRSVIFAHTMEWIQPFEYLMVSSGPKQNYVEVSRDFSDLKEKVKHYLANLDEAERIANNSVATFRDRYLTPAAETCYWRKLIHAWREVSYESSPYITRAWANKAEITGVAFEDFALRYRSTFRE